jgi:hypothetical protein
VEFGQGLLDGLGTAQVGFGRLWHLLSDLSV